MDINGGRDHRGEAPQYLLGESTLTRASRDKQKASLLFRFRAWLGMKVSGNCGTLLD